jgi:hypothetical protein
VSHSLLGQLGMRRRDFLDTAYDYDPPNLLPHHGLIGMRLGGASASYTVFLDEGPLAGQAKPFEDWWEKIVIDDKKGARLSRKTLVLALSNKDGGAHIDPELDDTYANLKLNNTLGWVSVHNGVETPFENGELFSLRQVAHEVLRTLVPDYPRQSPPNWVA